MGMPSVMSMGFSALGGGQWSSWRLAQELEWNDSVFLIEFQGGCRRALHTGLVLKPLTLFWIGRTCPWDRGNASDTPISKCVCACVHCCWQPKSTLKTPAREQLVSDPYSLLDLSLGRGVLHFRGIPNQRIQLPWSGIGRLCRWSLSMAGQAPYVTQKLGHCPWLSLFMGPHSKNMPP